MSDLLVTTDWAEKNLRAEGVRFIEVDVDTKAYAEGHLPGAVGWNWSSQLCDTVRRDVVSKADLEALLGASGVTNDTTIVLYGDNNNWFACWAYWQLEMYGHEKLRILDGGRKKWIAESRPLSAEPAAPRPEVYRARDPDGSLRALLPETMAAYADRGNWALVDVRSPDEYSGKILCPPGLPETCQRGGHIPGAVSVPWGKNCNDDGTFKSPAELRALYEPLGVTPDKGVVAYCRIGERSSLSWFVLRRLLGYPKVKNYDGSWTEWGNLVAAPVARGEARG